MPALNVNTDAVVALTRRLEKMRKHDFPVVVRRSLNSVAFDNRNKDLPAEYQKSFIQRNKATIRHFSWVQNSQGNSVNKMRSISGFINKGKSRFYEGIIAQEFGGELSRSRIANDKARTGGANNRMISKDNKLSNIGGLRSKGIRKGNKKGFVKAAHAAGKGGVVKYGRHQFRIKSIKKGKFKAIPIYSDVTGRKIKVEPTGTVRKSGITSGRRMERFFISEAKKRILRK